MWLSLFMHSAFSWLSSFSSSCAYALNSLWLSIISLLRESSSFIFSYSLVLTLRRYISEQRACSSR